MPDDQALAEVRARLIHLSQQLEDVPPASLVRLRAVEDGLGEVRAALRELSAAVAALRAKVEPAAGAPRLPASLVRQFLDAHPGDVLARDVEVPRFGDRRVAEDVEGPIRRYLAAVMPDVAREIAAATLYRFAEWVNARGGGPRRARPGKAARGTPR